MKKCRTAHKRPTRRTTTIGKVKTTKSKARTLFSGPRKATSVEKTQGTAKKPWSSFYAPKKKKSFATRAEAESHARAHAVGQRKKSPRKTKPKKSGGFFDGFF